MHGLRPAYDVSAMVWKAGTNAEDGSFVAEYGELKINSLDGDIYRTEGYRLPTEAEQEFLHRAGGEATGLYHFGYDVEALKWRRVGWRKAIEKIRFLRTYF